jgi:hypothetical protein
MSGFLRNLSAQALGRSASVRAAARLPYAVLPAIVEPQEGDQTSSPLAAAPVASPTAAPQAADQFSRVAADISHAVSALHLPPRQVATGDMPLRAHPIGERAKRDPVAPPIARAEEAASPARAQTPAPLVPTATHFVPPPAFVPLPPASNARTADTHQHSNNAETTEVHVSIGRIELTAVQEASPPARRASPVKPSSSLHDYLARRLGRSS